MAEVTKKMKWKLNEIVTLVVLAVALGVLWWGWTFVSALASPLSSLGLNYLLVGFWFTGGTLIPFLIRRPGAALAGEVLAAVVEGFITQWGITAALWGLVQGAGAEAVFLATGYKRYDKKTLMLAGAASGICSYTLDFFYSHYAGLQPWVWGIQIVSIVAGGVVLGGLLAYWVGKKLIASGAVRSLLPTVEAEDEESVGKE